MTSHGKNKNHFGEGDMALLQDRKNRRYLVTLSPNQIFHSHLGQLPHSKLIDGTVGGWYRTDRGHVLLAVRPTLGDFVLEMPRGPQIIYPKDLGNIISMADIFPGATVIEGGLGSGSLTAALLRAVGSAGQVITYEINESIVPNALRNVQKVVPDTSNLTITIGDIYEGITQREVDRVVLDVPEPWQAVSGIGDALVMGGILLSFLPTILQVHHLVNDLNLDGRFQMIQTIETLLRTWHVTERSVRPDHRMVAHSGFLTIAVRCEPRVVGTVANPIIDDPIVIEDQNSEEDATPEE
ncbi:MAG: tRNA (adenine-N1)-methyltransferase [Chloroflexi bacterium]|nr:tRNA (adenine-N1)-methyltransferase [Chloroflexota bacterium]MDA1219810.1 tRNA (adenine-N1)-methyltransferase [Chloroflexota bacterium]